MMLSVILLSILMILLSILSMIRHLICGNNQNWLLNLNQIYETLWTGAGSSLLISMLNELSLFHLTGLIAMVLLIRNLINLFLKNHLVRCWSCPSFLNWIGALTLSLVKSASKKIGALICSVKFVSPKVALYLYKSIILHCMEHCCHVWAGAPSCYLKTLDKLQKRIWRTVGPSVAAFLESLAHP